jgi:hypothetical protein
MTETVTTKPEAAAPIESRAPDLVSGYDSEPENWLSRAISIFLAVAIVAVLIGGIIGILHHGGHF